MFYADDTQLYVTRKGSLSRVTKIESCIDQIRHWMSTNMLVLNEGKSEIVKFSPKFGRNNGSPLGDDNIVPSVKVRNLGVIMDNNATMSAHVSNLCTLASFALYQIGKIGNILDQSSTEK
ncbi:hypothetical protein HOLleu_11803 [Holothuria leucospilota]|uniref:Reverse transcriptase domain-containing protein n=1 Tax=Holothuria leucospilota TaxID=206669 RepID=A0A9Q1HCK6_HOLLE|nr:hypothetical protein HOLleu_11803 [Holothuria leucospilota]